jgi:type II secretory pathway predicted ATPase ExeA
MYETFYGLQERPFDLAPNPRFLLLTGGHRRALLSLEFGIASRKGIVALIGEPGTGKTTVARALIARRGGTTRFVYLNQALASPADLRRCLAHSFGLGPEAETSNTELIAGLTRELTSFREQGGAVALIVDEAQSLSDDLLEEIRLLSNVETAEGKLLTLVLIGQPKLASRLNADIWKQLKQRIEIRCELLPLDLPETAAYIWSRVKTAGGDASQLFTADAVRLIHERSQGIARSISVICENALMAGFADGERPVTRKLVTSVCADLDLADEPEPAPAPARPAPILQVPSPQAAAAARQTTPITRRDPRAERRPAATGGGWWWWFFSGAWLRS